MNSGRREPHKLFKTLLPKACIATALVCAVLAAGADARSVKSSGGKGAAGADDPGCRSCMSRATSLFATGKGGEAAELLRQWSARCPHYAQLHLLLSTILIREGGQQEEAAAAAGRAVTANPNLTAARLQYGLTLMTTGNTTSAAGELEKMVDLDPASYEGWSTLAGLYSQLHEDGKAQEAAKKAADLEPGTKTVRLRTLKNLTRSGKSAEAVAELKRLIDGGEFGPEFMQQLASEAMDLRAYDEAIQACARVSAAYPLSLSPLRSMARAQLAKHDFNGCLDTTRKMSRVDGKDADAHSLAGLALVRMGRPDDADKEIQAALALAPHQGLALAGAGSLYCARGDYARAAESIQHSLDADPALSRDPDLCFNLAQALEKEGDPDFSLSYYKQSLAHGLSGDEAKAARQAVERLQSK